MQTKEELENELESIKKEIKLGKDQEHLAILKKFKKSFDRSAVLLAKNSIIYLIFILIFVVMIKMQLLITERGQAQQGIKDFFAE